MFGEEHGLDFGAEEIRNILSKTKKAKREKKLVKVWATKNETDKLATEVEEYTKKINEIDRKIADIKEKIKEVRWAIL